MPARNPEDVGRLIVEAINNGDVEAAIAMYDAEAAAPDSQGEVSSGTTDAFRQNTASSPRSLTSRSRSTKSSVPVISRSSTPTGA